MSDVRILIGADLVPTPVNYELFENGDIEALCGSQLIDLLKSADYRIFNLESPLTDEKTPIEKVGPTFMAPTNTISGIKEIGADFLTLANNHILDQGEHGLHSTISLLEKNAISYSGAGKNLDEAAQPHVVRVKDKRIGIYCCAEHEFSIAGKRKAGANPFDPLESLDQIADLKSQCDYLICLYHGGKEHYRYPSPELQKVCRKIIEKGADFVVCQHSHCVGCEEHYSGGRIVYGQGNFLFNLSKREGCLNALLIEIRLGESTEILYHPIEKTERGNQLANEAEGQAIINGFIHRSEKICDEEFIYDTYKEFSHSVVNTLLPFTNIFPLCVWHKVLNKITGQRYIKWYLGRHMSQKKRKRIKNLIECESLRELVLQLMGD